METERSTRGKIERKQIKGSRREGNGEESEEGLRGGEEASEWKGKVEKNM